MSFPRAAIKRFNEPADTAIPPPGTYDPNFPTDLATVISAALKASHEKRQFACVKSRSEETELHLKFRKAKREGTFTRLSSSTANTADPGKREPVVTYKQLYQNSKSRVRSHSQSSCNSLSAKTRVSNQGLRTNRSSYSALSTSSSTPGSRPNPEVKVEENAESNNDSKQSSSPKGKCLKAKHKKYETDRSMGQGDQDPGVIQQDLQREIDEYKQKHAEEMNRCKDFEVRNAELEFMINSLLRELEKQETERKATEEMKRTDAKTQTTREEMTSEKDTNTDHIDEEIPKINDRTNESQAKLIFLEDSDEAVLVASFEVCGTVSPL